MVRGAGYFGHLYRAYQLINLPTENLNTAIGSVAFRPYAR
jgi:hypothetical protein